MKVSQMILIAAVLSSALMVNAYCPNGCSGHGSCGTNDKCTCYTRPGQNTDPAWTEHDCSMRTCPKGTAWADAASADHTAHASIECSAKGLCDRKTGECKCFDNYSGAACERTVCPDDCNGRGRCITQKQLAYEASKTYDTPWDNLKHMGCVCDLGFRGPDCSQQECPSSNDIMLGKGNNHGRDCSGRGTCDYKSGLCKCYQGFYGTKCQSQTILN